MTAPPMAASDTARSVAEDDSLVLRAATTADRPRIMALMQAAFSTGDVLADEDFWIWKHEANPFGRSPVLIAETLERQVVGVRAFMRWAWQSGAQTVPVVRAVDTVTHPDWRGRGIFTRLTLRLLEDVREEGVAFVFNTPNEKSRPGYLKMGWEDVGTMTVWARPLRPLRILRALLPPGKASGKERSARVGNSVEELLAQPEIEAFLKAHPSRDRRYATPRSPAYLRWRYHAIPPLRPHFRYRALWAFEGGAGAILIHRQRQRSGLVELGLSEVLASPTPAGQQLARSLIRILVRETDADYMVSVAGKSTPQRSVLWRAGFVPVPGVGPRLTTHVLNVPAWAPSPRVYANWRLDAGSIELF